MFQNRHYIILGILVGLVVSVYTIVIGENGSGEKTAPVAVEKEKIKSPIEIIREHMEKRENDLAIEAANKYLESDPQNTKVVNLLAQAYIGKGDLSAAEITIKKAITIKPSEQWSYRILASIYEIKGNKEKDVNSRKNYFSLALDQIEKGLTYNSNNIWLLGDAALLYFEQGNKTKAKQMLDKALIIDPKSDFLRKIKDRINK